MIKAVFDTNVLVSAAIVPNGVCAQAMRLAVQRRFILCTSPDIISEFGGILRMRFNFDDVAVKRLLQLLRRCSVIVQPRHRVTVLADDPDNRVLECAEAAKANLIVSGDKPMRRLGTWQGIPIVRAADLVHSVQEG